MATEYEIIGEVQSFCADIEEHRGGAWTTEDGEHVANLINQAADPWGLFRYMDESTGSSDVGYRTRDGREWFHILRQMRNKPGSGLFETLRPR